MKEIYPIFGEYSFLVKIEASTVDEILNIILNKIRPLTGVLSTQTLLEVKL